MKRRSLTTAIRSVLGVAVAASLTPGVTWGQNDQSEQELEEVFITGSRIVQPGVESSSLITSIDETALDLLQEPEFERILRSLPGTIPGDNPNVNNGTAGAATIDLRGLGPQRNLVLMNGRRMVPFNLFGRVDTTTIPTALIERVDIVTGGASAVYGSDAIAGAINVILKNDFEGVELELGHSETGESDGDTDRISLTVGSNFDEDRGNAVLSFSYSDRDAVLLGQRPLGLLGINSNTGSGLDEFNAGEPPLGPIAGCGGPNVVDIDGSGSTTAIPTRFAIPGAGVSGQFREDRTIGEECSLFNFNPFNFYQTPLERYSATAITNYEINENFEVYGTVNYTNSTVQQQVAPSGTFGARFDLPLYNPFIDAEALDWILDNSNAAVTAGTLVDGGNWEDLNANGVVDSEDMLNVQLRRRTVELGPRTERYDTDTFQFIAGLRGDITDSWEYDVSYSYGETNRTTVRDGYTNLTNIQSALMTRDGVTCENGDSTCVPIDIFGGFGTITDEMAGYARAIALQQQKYEQEIITAFATGAIEAVQLPSASNPLALSVGYEHRKEIASLEPDECLKEAPASCQGGAGGNLLPISGGYTVEEFFFESILPLVEDAPGAERLDLEMGFRTADYDTTGSTDSWKFGANWRIAEPVLVRVMQQEANRAPNVGELSSPVTTALRNATLDPCSVANAGNIDATLRERCISTGMTDAQVGVVQDIVSGQINTLEGSDPNNLPDAEKAETFTAGVVLTPTIPGLSDFMLSVDYYDIEVEDIIGLPSAQETLDGCYVLGIDSECARITRVDGDLTSPSSGVQLFTTNLNYEQAEGIEIGFVVGVSLEEMGELTFSGNINKYLTQESQSRDTTPVLDCKGFYGTSCDPVSELRWVQTTTWAWNDLTVSARWRHIGSVDVEEAERDLRFEEFRSIDSFDYIDLFASYDITENVRVSLGIDNLLDEDPPVLGNDIGDTSSNSGNTFPGNYDTLGRIYRTTLNVRF